jgi:hypothetical protein
MFSQDVPAVPLTTLDTLNAALMRLQPSISGIGSAMLEVPGMSTTMLNAEIAGNPFTLYNGVKRADVLNALRPGLANRVNNDPINFVFDQHGEKHFPGGPPGTKFTAGQAIVNPILTGMINPHRGSIRRHANGQVKTYYLTAPAIAHSDGATIAIQVDYTPDPESIGFHGYPRANLAVFRLSETLGGPAIPA